MSIEHVKASAYDALAELAVTAKTKLLRGEASDAPAILAAYFHQSVAAMRRTGLACRVSRNPNEHQRIRLTS